MTLSIRRRSLMPIATGLATAQLIALFYVRQASLHQLQRVEALEAAGWLAIPAGPAAALLNSYGTAFWGGLFFTLSVGSGLTLATWALCSLWQRLFGCDRRLILGGAGVWLALIALVNASGWALFPSLFVVFVPSVTLLASVQRAPREAAGSTRTLWFLPLVTLVLLTALWTTQLNRQMFSTIRDHLLLSNTVGRQVNDFYYRYTLFAAQAFKSFEQQTIRSCRLDPSASPVSGVDWTPLLARHDVLTVSGNGPVDLIIAAVDKQLRLVSARGDVIEVLPADFRKDPRTWLRRFSESEDRYGPFRRITLFGLLIGFPILLYVCVDGMIGRAAKHLFREVAVVWIRSIVCFVIGIALFLPMLGSRADDIATDRLAEALAAETWTRRVAALRQIADLHLDIADYPGYRLLLESPMVVERYWLARAMAGSRSPAVYADLLRLMRDPHPNVVCQAYYALGQSGRRAAAKAIQKQMVQSDHWYAQWYGYRAMRRLGWHQTRPNQ